MKCDLFKILQEKVKFKCEGSLNLMVLKYAHEFFDILLFERWSLIPPPSDLFLKIE